MNQEQRIAFAIERAKNYKENNLHELTISTRVPSKWRFLDLETGQVWKSKDGRFVLSKDE